LNLKVAYDNETSYPYWWYLRDYPNAFGFGGNPTRELREYPVILVGDPNYSKIEPVVKQDYYYFDYIRIWWPNEDYKTITWSAIDSERRLELSTRQDLKNQQPGAMTVLDYLARVWRKHIRPFFVDARVRDAIWQIWLNRDYTRYAELTGHTDLTQATWSPSGRMRLYVRKDVASQLWDYGPVQTTIAEEVDPYQGRQVQLSADKTIGFLGSGDGQLQGPRGMALAPDGSLYVADTFNHRIQHFAADGTFIKQWGSFADVAKSEAPMGTFYEPWGIAVGLDGSVYVADTWNHRVQKFTADGEPITMWGHGISQDSQDMLGFYGPRSIVVDAKRHVLVTDTGNARVIVFDENGTPLTQFGSPGLELGQFAEPVGLALDAEGQLYVADTWNQRIQVFMPVSDGSYIPETSWDIAGWKSDSVNSKPYLAVDIQGHIFATDPDLYRVLEFTGKGEIVRYWGDIGNDQASFSLPTGIAVDSQNGVWVVDSGNNRLMHFILPK
jgi:DNA-binding beta-propeller fold protein YncE